MSPSSRCAARSLWSRSAKPGMGTSNNTTMYSGAFGYTVSGANMLRSFRVDGAAHGRGGRPFTCTAIENELIDVSQRGALCFGRDVGAHSVGDSDARFAGLTRRQPDAPPTRIAPARR